MKWIWPAIYSTSTAVAAARTASAAAFLVATVTGIFGLLLVLGLYDLISGAVLAVGTLMAAFLGVMIRRMSRVAAVTEAVLYAADRVYSGIVHGFSAGSILWILILLILISGVRGTFAYHRYRLRGIASGAANLAEI